MAVQLHFISFTEQGSKVCSFFFFQLTLVTFSQNSQNSVSLLHEDSVHVSSHISGFMIKLPSRIVQGKNLVTCKTVRKLEKAWKVCLFSLTGKFYGVIFWETNLISCKSGISKTVSFVPPRGLVCLVMILPQENINFIMILYIHLCE